jgi:hypothetical protein
MLLASILATGSLIHTSNRDNIPSAPSRHGGVFWGGSLVLPFVPPTPIRTKTSKKKRYFRGGFSTNRGTERYAQNQTQIVFLSFPLLLCLKLVADASPHHGRPKVLVRHSMPGHHHVSRLTLRTLSPLIRL